MTWAFCDSVAIYGLLLALLARDVRYYFAFAAAAVVGFIVYRPTMELTRSVARAAE